MSHTITSWLEYGMSTSQKVDALNNAEKVYDDAGAYLLAMAHAIWTKAEANSRFYKTPSHPDGRSDTGAGSGINAQFLDGKSLADIIAGGLPRGAIGMYGLGTIPPQLQECDGSNDSPDLRDFFLCGAGGNVTPGSTGGQNSLTPTALNFNSPDHILTAGELPKHSHTYSDNWNPGSSMSSDYGAVYYWYAVAHSRSATTDTINGYANGTPDPHSHAGCTFLWSGYKDENGVHHGGALDNRSPYIVVRFCMVK